MKLRLLICICLIAAFPKKTLFAQKSEFSFEVNTKMITVHDEVFPVTDVGAGPVILLLHGFPDSKEVWANQIPALTAAGYRVLAPDLRGVANAPSPLEKERYAIPLLMADVIGILDALNIQTAHVVGHDWGAALAWALATYQSQRFSSLIALSVGAPAGPGWSSIEQREKSWYFYLFIQKGLAEKSLTNNNWELFRAIAKGHKNIDEVIKRLTVANALTTALNWYRGNFLFLMSPCEGEYQGDGQYFPPGGKKVTLPVLGIWSENDHALLEPQMKESGVAVENTFVYKKISGAGHWMMLDKPKELNTALIEFINAHN